MKLFARFFAKAPPVPPTLEQQIAGLEGASGDVLAATALSTHAEALRCAAIARLSDGAALRALAALDRPDDGATSSLTERAARERLAQLIDCGAVDFDAFCRQVTHRSTVFSVAALCARPERLAQAFASVREPAQIAALVVSAPSSRVRQMAAEAIDDPLLIRELQKQVRAKDKNVYKILKQKGDAWLAAERKAAELMAERVAACAALERHALRTHDAAFPVLTDQLEARWRALPLPVADDLERRASVAIERCHTVIMAQRQSAQEHEAERARLAAERLAADNARHAALQLKREAAAAQLAAAAQSTAEERREAQVMRQAEESARAEQRAGEDALMRQIGGLLRNANAALSDGNTQRAAGLRRSLEEKLTHAPTLPMHLVRQVQQLDEKLQELKQWKDYAVAPKRIELLADMESLIGSADEPKLLAERIKALQEDWRTISKGIAGDVSPEWERFQHASQLAYQPCRDYFAAQAVVRQQNLESRTAVLERVMAFEAGHAAADPDWRLVARVLREAPQEWRQYYPVDREAGAALQKNFDASLHRLQAALDAWHDRNVVEKKALVERARQAQGLEDGREAVESVKRLQGQWKDTGPAPRDLEQALWSEFREICDAVFQRREQAHIEYSAGLEANRAAAHSLCDEVERIAGMAEHDLRASATIPEWRAAFDAIGELPRGDARALHERFKQAIERCTNALERQHRRDLEQCGTDLDTAADLVHAYEWASMTGAAPSDLDAARAAAQVFIAGVPRWPNGGLQAVQEAMLRADSSGAQPIVDREKLLRLLCIRAEIQSGVATPTEDDALRREYQVQRLIQGMGQGTHLQGDWHTLWLEWIRVGAVAPALRVALRERFMRSRPRASVEGQLPAGDARHARWG